MNIKADSIKLIACNPLGDSQTIVKEIPIDKKTSLEDLFAHIESDMNVYYLPEYYGYYRWGKYGNSCPYVCSKNTVYWNVPYQEVRVFDFLETHEIGNLSIKVEYDCLAGDGELLIDYLFQSWIAVKPILEAFGYAFTIKETVKLLVNAFGKRKQNSPAFSTLELYLLANDEWNLTQLVEQTRFPKAALVPILEMLGFEEHEGVYYRNAWKTHQYEVAREKIDYNKYISEYLGFNSNVPQYWAEALNTSLILLFELSDQADGQKTYDAVSVEIEERINSKEGHEDCYDTELDMINSEIKRLEDYLGIV